MSKKKQGTLLGQGLLEAASDALLWHQGKKELRVTDIEIEPPPEYSKVDIKEIREGFNVSQPVFAEIIGCSPSAVKAWEQGLKHPSMAARRLLQIISVNQEVVDSILKKKERTA
jgi:putative transcriptional regulator